MQRPPRLRGLLRFLSLTTATQACLAVNQLVLLPLQLRIWGPTTTRDWLVVIAVASLSGVSDLGLRNAGHADLRSSVTAGDTVAARAFRSVWALTRALQIVVTAALLAAQLLLVPGTGARHASWGCVMTVSLALDMTLIVRGIWLDTLGHFSRVELLFLLLVLTRTILSLGALAIFRLSPAGLSGMLLATAVLALAAQSWWFREPRSLGLFAGGFADLRWSSLAVVRFSLAEPATNWVRLSLPVIVLTTLATPRFVTVFVALRALFGLARQVSSQLARFASVSYVQRIETDPAGAEAAAVRSILLSTLMGLAVSGVVIVDHGRLLGAWLGLRDPTAEALAALSLATGATAYGHQVIAGILTRSGDLAGVARRQYAFLAASAVAALAGAASGSLLLYLAMLGAAELLIAVLFAPAAGVRIARVFGSSVVIGVPLIVLLWAVTSADPDHLFRADRVASIGLSLLAAASTTAAAAFAFWRIASRLTRSCAAA